MIFIFIYIYLYRDIELYTLDDLMCPFPPSHKGKTITPTKCFSHSHLDRVSGNPTRIQLRWSHSRIPSCCDHPEGCSSPLPPLIITAMLTMSHKNLPRKMRLRSAQLAFCLFNLRTLAQLFPCINPILSHRNENELQSHIGLGSG